MIDGEGKPYIIVWTDDRDRLIKQCSDMIDKGYKPAGGPWESINNGNSGSWMYQAMWREPSKEETDGRHL